MGELRVTKLSSELDRANYIHHLIKDIKALDLMVEKDLFEKKPIRIGAEQEFCLINDAHSPDGVGPEVLKLIGDEHFTTEIGNYNLEVNLDPIELKDGCFGQMHKKLNSFLAHASKKGAQKSTRILLSGILPTLTLDYMSVENMTPLNRYKILNEAVKESRKQEFDIHIKGVDDLNILHDSVMLEGCNTSFQMHLQVDPDEFLEKYNWAQAISGPLLSVCTNSPLLFGKELWSETRIALFTQSVDTRTNSFLLNEKQARVSFGNRWETGTISDIFKDNVSRFRSLLTSEYIRDSVEMLNTGEIPKLLALSLHNGTVYRWNRVCYGVGNNKPHLRIENRYIPAGPSVVDEMANMVFWVGLMHGQPEAFKGLHEKMDFRDAKANFYNAARYGRATQFLWMGQLIPSGELVAHHLLPMARKGLESLMINGKDIDFYLNIIQRRTKTHTGSEWMVQQYRALRKHCKPYEARQKLTALIYRYQKDDVPVCDWIVERDNTPCNPAETLTVRHKMSNHTFTVDENDSLELVLHIMSWKNIHHVPVIDSKKKLIGLLTWNDLAPHKDQGTLLQQSVKTLMKPLDKIITIHQDDSIEKVLLIMRKSGIRGLPVVRDELLLGIITSNDLNLNND